MGDFSRLDGFEDLWRAPGRLNRRSSHPLLRPSSGLTPDVRARLERLVGHTPEVVVRQSGAARTRGDLRTHLSYISRGGEFPLEDRDGVWLRTLKDAVERATIWEETSRLDLHSRAFFPLAYFMVLSSPTGSDPAKVRDAVRSFAQDRFAPGRDYVFVLHTDTANPHVHLTLNGRGENGRGLSFTWDDLQTMRERYAELLRDRGVEAEATPRRARGVTRKSEPFIQRKMREKAELGLAPHPKVLRSAYRDAARAAFLGETQPTHWEELIFKRQMEIRKLYLEQAELLKQSSDADDRTLGEEVEAFVRQMPAPATRRLALARELRAAAKIQRQEAELKSSDRSHERAR